MTYPLNMKKSKPNKTLPREVKHAHNTRLAKFIKSIRESRDISQAELSEMLGLGRAYVSHLEMGLYQYPLDSLKNLTKLLTKQDKAELLALMIEQVKEDLGV